VATNKVQTAYIKGIARDPGASGGAGAMGPRNSAAAANSVQPRAVAGIGTPMQRRADLLPAQAMGPRGWKEEFMLDPLGSLHGGVGGVGGGGGSESEPRWHRVESVKQSRSAER
jgi:hypothetical protein